MPLYIKNFLGGKMNKDVDERVLPQGQFRDALNIQVANSENSDSGSIQKSLSNKVLTSLNIGANVKTIGSRADEFEEKIYTLLKSDLGCYITEYDINKEQLVFVLKDTRIGLLNVLQFDENKLVTGINIVVDTDNNNRLLLFTDYNTQPKCLNIERAKTYSENGFTEEMILLIKKPPLDAPSLLLAKTNSEENNIEEKFLAFSYRYNYLDEEYSALAPFSEYAFTPKNFNYDFSTGVNESMINANNIVYITIDSGSDLVKEIEVVFKESGKNNIYLIETYNKKDKNWGNNSSQTISFNNNKIYGVLPEKELFRLYDNVPILAKDQEIIDNILVYGQYDENFDLIDQNGNDVNIDLIVSKISNAILNEVGTKSLKSNRDYEIGIAYLDEYGRLTTPLTSEGNTVHIPNYDSLNQNKIKVKIRNKPPYFAKKYRFFIKQNKGDYETIVPTLFYEEGSYRWVKLEQSDKDKIKEGDILTIKSDTQGQTNKLYYTKVLEVTRKEDNFLSNVIVDATNNGSDITEEKGIYFKIKPNGFRMNRADFTFFEFDSYDDSSSKYSDPVRNQAAVIDKAVFYGTVGVDDLTEGGVYNGNSDVRYRIEIDGATTFKWSKDDGANWVATAVSITAGVAQNLDNGVQITFASGTNRDIGDYWVVSAKISLPSSGSSKAYAFYKSLNSENIESGSRINIVYDEYNEYKEYIDKNFISSRFYENLEEWFHGEDIATDLQPLTKIYFRVGILRGLGESHYFTQDNTGVMTMIIETIGTQNNGFDKRAKVKSHIDIFQSKDAKIIFETKPKEFNSDIFFEIGRTCDIVDGYHLGYDANDINQESGVDADILLEIFNCFSWGNGFESYKIKDLFNAKSFFLDTRPSIPINNYKRNKRIASFTWSRNYEQSTNYNALNEFNLSLFNFKDLDDSLGSIQRMKSLNTDLDIWQEDKVTKAYYKKTLMLNQDGSENLIKSNEIFKSIKPYAGEFGISKNPEGLVIFGNFAYWPDVKRGVILRKGQSGIEIISNFGMKNWFRNVFKNPNLRILGGYDPFKGQYVINIKDIPPIIVDSITVANVILNTASVQGLIVDSNYKWFSNGFSSDLNILERTLGPGVLDLYSSSTGEEGKGIYPKTNGIITLESFKNLLENNVTNQVKLGYLISNTLYDQNSYATIKSNATFITPEKTIINNGEKNLISFYYNRPNKEKYLYLIWDYSSIFLSAAISELVSKDDCSIGNITNGILYTIPQGAFSSEISQVDADAQAQSSFDSTKQDYANLNGVCIPIKLDGNGNELGGGLLVLGIDSTNPNINNQGTLSFWYGNPNETITLKFVLSSISGGIGNSISFDNITTGIIDNNNVTKIANIVLDANGNFISTYTITDVTSCSVSILSRSSPEQIPFIKSTIIDNISPRIQ